MSRVRFPARPRISLSEKLIFFRAQKTSCPMGRVASYSGGKLTRALIKLALYSARVRNA
jgi:hypothetical protein